MDYVISLTGVLWGGGDHVISLAGVLWGGGNHVVSLTGVLGWSHILAWVGLSVVAGLGEQFVTVRIYWIELQNVRQWNQFPDSGRFALCCIIDEF